MVELMITAILKYIPHGDSWHALFCDSSDSEYSPRGDSWLDSECVDFPCVGMIGDVDMLYPIAITRGDDTTAHGIFVPDIEGCFSAADDYQDTFDNAIEAIKLHLEGLVEDGEQIPLPSSIDNYANKPEYQDMMWALVHVDAHKKAQ